MLLKANQVINYLKRKLNTKILTLRNIYQIRFMLEFVSNNFYKKIIGILNITKEK